MKKKYKSNIVVTTGGTGGHVFPAISLANKLVKEGYGVIFVVDSRGLQYCKNLNENIKIKQIQSYGLHKKSINVIFKMIYKIAMGFLQSIVIMIKNKPRTLISFGSYATIPVIIAGILFKIPILMHEQNAYLGKSHKIFVKFAKYLFISFKNTKNIPKNINTIFTGLPIREDFYLSHNHKLNYADNKIAIGIFGGSQGASIFAGNIVHGFIKLSKEQQQEIRVYHQCRPEYIHDVQNLWNKTNIDVVVKPFFDNMANLIFNLDVIISRSGASSIYEFSLFKKHTLYVPFAKSANNHQELNAISAMEMFGDIQYVLEKNFNSNYIYNFLTNILHNKYDILNKKTLLTGVSTMDNNDKCLNNIMEIINKNIVSEFRDE